MLTVKASFDLKLNGGDTSTVECGCLDLASAAGVAKINGKVL
jgi:hypothetical protein